MDSSWLRLRDRLIAGCAAVTAAGFLLIALDIWVEYRTTIDRAGAETATLARVLDEQTQRALSTVDRLIEGVAVRAAESGSMDGAAVSFEQLLGEKLADFPQVSSVWLFNAAGTEVISRRRSGARAAPIGVADTDYFYLHREDQDYGLHIGSPRQGQVSGRWIVPMSRGVWRDGHFVGVVLAAIDIAYLQRLYRAIDTGADGLVALMRLDGVTITRLPEATGAPGATDDSGSVEAAITVGPSGTLDSVSAADDVRRLVSYRTVGDSGLVVSVGYALTDVLAGWYRTLLIEGLAALLLVALGLAGYLFLRRGLSQQQRIEDLRVERESFARASEAKTAFLANMSHELRTPLNAVLGFAQLMENEAFGPLGNARYRDYSGEIVRSGEHLLRLLDGILDLSRIDTARLALDERGFALNRLLGDARALAMGKADARSVAVTIEDGLPGTVIRADLRRLTHALANLLDNAVRSSPPHSTVRISTRRGEDGRLIVCVTDQGAGISAEDAEDALSPWRKASSVTTGRSEGSGLGLPLAKSVAALHGGDVYFVVGDAHGATAELTLPPERIIATSPALVEMPGGPMAADRRAAFG